ncbi:MAG: right-handed parallel beta-helix repeat-containing protein [Pseudomonadota bacterium]
MLASPARAQVACGDVVRGMVTLEQDLTCATEPGLTVRGQLDMNGFTLRCDGTARGIVLAGRRSGLQNGEVENCDEAVVLNGRGRHEVVRVGARGTTFGFLLNTGSNRLVLNTASAVDGDAFRVAGRSNYLVENEVEQAGDDGFDIKGRNNTVTRSVITGVAGTGIEVNGKRNVILANTVVAAGEGGIQLQVGGNRVIGNTLTRSTVGLLVQNKGNEILGNVVLANRGTGIQVSFDSKGNRIIGNEAEGNGTDMLDEAANCGTNLWQGNVFGVVEPAACIN